MAEKIVLPTVNGGYNLSTINDNFQKIEEALNEKVLYRENPPEEPNQLENDIDMNGQRIYNLPVPVLAHEAARVQDLLEAKVVTDQNAARAEAAAVISEGLKDQTEDLRDQAAASAADAQYIANLFGDVAGAVSATETIRDQTEVIKGQTQSLYNSTVDQANIATAQANYSNAARLLSEAARDAAAGAVNMRMSKAAGEADSTIPDGGYYSVPAPGTTYSFILYRKSGGVGTEITRYPAANGFVWFPPQSGLLGGFVTPTGRILMAFSIEDGSVIFGVGGNIGQQLQNLASQLGIINGRMNIDVRRAGYLHAWLTNTDMKLMHSDDQTGRIKIWNRDVLDEIDTAKTNSSNALSTANNAYNLLIPSKDVLIIGDSLSAGSSSWAATINTDTTVTGRAILNLAVGGQKSTHQSGRLGVVPFLITLQNNTILASGSSVVTLSRQMKRDGTFDNVSPITNQGPTWNAKLMGISGTFSSATFDGNGNPTALVFTPTAGQLTVDKKIDEDTPAESLSAVGSEMRLLLVGIGRNNTAEFDNVCRDLLAIRDKWQTTPQKRMIVVTPPPRWKNPSTGTVYGEGSGGSQVAVWNQIIAIEKWTQANFGEYVVCSRQELMRNASTSADDVEAVANQSVPPSLTTDGLHWSTAGHAIIRAAAAAIINRKDY